MLGDSIRSGLSEEESISLIIVVALSVLLARIAIESRDFGQSGFCFSLIDQMVGNVE